MGQEPAEACGIFKYPSTIPRLARRFNRLSLTALLAPPTAWSSQSLWPPRVVLDTWQLIGCRHMLRAPYTHDRVGHERHGLVSVSLARHSHRPRRTIGPRDYERQFALEGRLKRHWGLASEISAHTLEWTNTAGLAYVSNRTGYRCLTIHYARHCAIYCPPTWCCGSRVFQRTVTMETAIDYAFLARCRIGLWVPSTTPMT